MKPVAFWLVLFTWWNLGRTTITPSSLEALNPLHVRGFSPLLSLSGMESVSLQIFYKFLKAEKDQDAQLRPQTSDLFSCISRYSTFFWLMLSCTMKAFNLYNNSEVSLT